MQVSNENNIYKLKVNGNKYVIDADIIKYLVEFYHRNIRYARRRRDELLKGNKVCEALKKKYAYNTMDDLIEIKLENICNDILDEEYKRREENER